MSSVAESPDATMALQSHYSLRWNNHQAHILQAFEALLHAETLVDVTLVCSETSLRAHKVVLSACSPFFERIFAEHPCKHPVIVLKDFPGREVAALIDFMYRGEVRVGREELPGLMRAAESLQVRGLALSEPRPASPPETPTTELLGEPSTPEGERQGSPDDDENMETTATRIDTRGGIVQEQRLPHMGHLNFSVRDLRELCSSPLMPRRKQARPRRRSGELVPQDLSRPHPPPSSSPVSGLNLAMTSQQRQETQQQTSTTPTTPSSSTHNNSNNNNNNNNSHQSEDIAENLSLKRPQSTESASDHPNRIKVEREQAGSPRSSPLAESGLHSDASPQDLATGGLTVMSALTLTPPHQHSEYMSSLGQLGQLAAQWLPSHPSQLQQGHPAHLAREEGSPQQHGRLQHNPFQQRESSQCRDQQEQQRQEESSLSSIRSVRVFPVDGISPVGGAGGLFPHGGGLDRGSLLADLHDSFKPEALHGLFGSASLVHHPSKKLKKHRSDGGARRWSDHGPRGGMPIGRPKGQHSAPRGGPPRSWTNAELTIALQHVWNKQMTTSQASRMFGIPYNSLLMYVRGKYGKSLKLEQLRRDCTGATTGEVMNSLNNNVKAIQAPPQLSHPLAGLQHPGDDGSFGHHPLLGGNLPQGFFPDYSTAFPVPVNMVHLLPPSEQKGMEPTSNPGGGGSTPGSCPSGSVAGCPPESGSPQDSDLQQPSRSPSPVDTINNHETSSSSITAQAPQTTPAILQQNGSD